MFSSMECPSDHFGSPVSVVSPPNIPCTPNLLTSMEYKMRKALVSAQGLLRNNKNIMILYYDVFSTNLKHRPIPAAVKTILPPSNPAHRCFIVGVFYYTRRKYFPKTALNKAQDPQKS